MEQAGQRRLVAQWQTDHQIQAVGRRIARQRFQLAHCRRCLPVNRLDIALGQAGRRENKTSENNRDKLWLLSSHLVTGSLAHGVWNDKSGIIDVATL